MTHEENVSRMIGKTPVSISGGLEGEDEIVFRFSDGTACRFYHQQDCCENVSIADLFGDWHDLIGHPLCTVDEKTNPFEAKFHRETWTFYTFRTIAGTVDVRWYGASNGHYSERVDFEWLDTSQSQMRRKQWGDR